MQHFLNELQKSRKALNKNRKRFWKRNKINFEANIMKIIKKQKMPSKFRIYVVASNFLPNKKLLPFDYDAWNGVYLLSATKKQGFEILMFFNRANAFLSLPALVPMVAHELCHVKQAAKKPKNYLASSMNDKIAKKLEQEADAVKLPEEFRKQYVLEHILYCYDTGGWRTAQKMADYLYRHAEDMYAGGYRRRMTKEEYKAFLLAKIKKRISIFIDFF